MSTVNDTAAGDLGREDLQLVAEGDKRAFARLYDAWAPTLFALISCVLKDRAQAEEVLQDTFLHVWRRAPSYDPGRGSVRAWLTTIARRRAIDRVRSAQAARDRELASPPDVDWDQTAEEAESRILADDVVQVEVDVAEVRADDVPVDLLAHELEGDEVGQDTLKVVAQGGGSGEGKVDGRSSHGVCVHGQHFTT